MENPIVGESVSKCRGLVVGLDCSTELDTHAFDVV